MCLIICKIVTMTAMGAVIIYLLRSGVCLYPVFCSLSPLKVCYVQMLSSTLFHYRRWNNIPWNNLYVSLFCGMIEMK